MNWLNVKEMSCRVMGDIALLFPFPLKDEIESLHKGIQIALDVQIQFVLAPEGRSEHRGSLMKQNDRTALWLHLLIILSVPLTLSYYTFLPTASPAET